MAASAFLMLSNPLRPGFALMAKMKYLFAMKTLTLKLPENIAHWLESEARRLNRTKSAIVREVLAAHQHRSQSALEASDLCGSVQSRHGDLSYNKARLKGFGR
jgi:predicted DNA-binding protein